MQNITKGGEKAFSIAILVSGRGSNLLAILENLRSRRLPGVRCALVLADNAKAGGLSTAREFGIPAEYLDPGPKKTYLIPEAEARWIGRIKQAGVDLVCLAGFMRVLKAPFIDAFEGRILNIHPSLLPKFPGLNVQQRAIDAGERESGCTVHWVDKGVDSGPILGQRRVPIHPGDTAETLAARILKEEHVLYSEVLAKVASGVIPLPNPQSGASL